MLDVWTASVDSVRADYDRARLATDPTTFQEYMASIDQATPHKAALSLLQEFIDNQRAGPVVVQMHWQPISLASSSIPLLTSDRPLDMPLGLGANEAYIALPIGPKLLFVAGYDDALAKRLASAKPVEVVKSVNKTVVQQARKFVWGVDERQHRFVENRMSRDPDRPVITEEQKRRAIDASATFHSTAQE